MSKFIGRIVVIALHIRLKVGSNKLWGMRRQGNKIKWVLRHRPPQYFGFFTWNALENWEDVEVMWQDDKFWTAKLNNCCHYIFFFLSMQWHCLWTIHVIKLNCFPQNPRFALQCSHSSSFYLTNQFSILTTLQLSVFRLFFFSMFFLYYFFIFILLCFHVVRLPLFLLLLCNFFCHIETFTRKIYHFHVNQFYQ